jgi:porin
VVELTWRVPITGWLHLQPDLQYVINPNTDPARRNALLAIFRIDLAY